MGACESWHTCWSLVSSRSGYNVLDKAVWGMYNAVYVVKLIVHCM